MLDSLKSLLLDTNTLTKNMTKPQEVLDYLSQVLVPEVTIRFISQDLKVTLEQAQVIIKESIDFGSYVQDV